MGQNNDQINNLTVNLRCKKIENIYYTNLKKIESKLVNDKKKPNNLT